MQMKLVAHTGLVLLATTSIAHAVDPVFSDQTVSAGVNVSHATGGFTQSQYAGGGAVGDFNNDGWSDFFFISGGSNNAPDKLFINNGNGTFTDRAAEWGLTTVHRGKSACVGDFNHDGWVDLYVTSAGPVGTAAPGHHKLYKNNGNGTFTNIAASAGVAFADPTAESAWTSVFGDYDLDGDLDLFVGGFAGAPSNTEHHLFKNNGNETFTDVTASIALFNGIGPVAALGARFADMDGDRYPELLISADFKGSGNYIGSRYFKNDGDGTFTDLTTASHTGEEENGMGQTICDFDNDGKIDWYVTSIYQPSINWTGNKLYRNIQPHSYIQMSQFVGVNDGAYGWGTVAIDFNHDGWEDIAETNGDASQGSQFYDDPGRLWVNNGNFSFSEKAATTGFVHNIKGRALLRLDYDNDGDQDVLIFRNNGALTLFRNDLPAGPNTRWLRILLNTNDHPQLAGNGVGTRIRVKTGSVNRTRLMDCGISFLGTSEISAHFGLGSATVVDEIELKWTDGTITTLHDVAVDQTLTLSPESSDCPGDLDASGVIDAADLSVLLGAWGGAAGDLDGSGTTDAGDLAVLLGAWGDC